MKKNIEYMGTWSISPEGAGASIDENGKVILPQNTGTTPITYTISYIDIETGCETSTTVKVNACSGPISNVILYITYVENGNEQTGIILCINGDCNPDWQTTRPYLEDENKVVISARYGNYCNETGTDTFGNFSGLTAVTMTNNIKNISNWTFRNCVNLSSIELSWNIRTIGEYAFSHCHKLTSIDITDHYLESIGRGAFEYCSGLTDFNISNNLKEISDYLLEYCTSLTTINIPSSIKKIGQRAFLMCSGLTTCYIGDGVTSIGDMAFFYCTSLNSITIEATAPPTIGTSVFESTTCNIYVPDGSVADYKTAWSGKIDNVERIKPISDLPTN